MPKMPTATDQARAHRLAREMRRVPFTELRDFTKTPEALEKEIDAGNVDGLATIYRLKGNRFGIMNGGFSAEGLFAVLCEMRRQMIATQGMVDEDDQAANASLREEIHKLGLEVVRLRGQSDPQGRGRDGPVA